MSNPYRRGADFEREVRSDLELRGYLAVRAAGSKGRKDDAKIDLIALYPYIGSKAYFSGRPVRSRTDDLLVLQCKLSGDVTQVDRLQLIRVARKYGCAPVIVSKTEQGINYDFLSL